MLERIINISPGSDYKNSASKSGSYHRSSQFLSALQSSLSDSISLSPATAFLSSVHWRLKKLSNEKEKNVIVFEFDGFEFTAHVGQPDILISHSIEYDVAKRVDGFFNQFDSTLQVLCGVSSMRENPGNRVELPALTSFVQNLTSLDGVSYSITADTTEVKKFFYQSKEALFEEFNYLNSCLITFLEKYLSIKYNFNADKNSNDELILRKVAITKLK